MSDPAGASHRPAPLAERLRAPGPGELAAAADAVSAHLPPTPLLPTAFGTQPAPAWLKLETTQPTGSFKVRGALTALAGLPAGARAVSASAGNHALGMAWAAGRHRVGVTVVTAENASPTKVAAIEELARRPSSGVILERHGSSYDEAEDFARGLAASDPGAVYVSGYSDWAVIAGDSTVGVEIGAAVPADEALTVVTPLGGGGLASGLSLWAAGRPGTRVVAAAAAASPAVNAAVRAGRRVHVQVGATIADGLAGNVEDGCPTPAILAAAEEAGVAELTTVEEDEIRAAMRWLFASHGLVAEGAGAAGLAAALSGRVRAAGRLVVVVSGRNVTPGAYAEVLTGA